ncbi:Uncharacterised protein [Mycobacterium tuberculosis]|nr:Uncharacterised protein [Mycobacterium tuberculosis]CNZ92984.1 Uncharacterised protein [Mycobacterium tuberculosis]CPA81038.1 Uncharacterised protein [Mycobacterium tuberculosis]
MIPSGVPPIPASRSVPECGRHAEIAPATSPSVISRIRAPVARTSWMSCACRGLSRMHTVMSRTDRSLTLATARMFSEIGAVISSTCAASGPTAILFM